MRILGVDPGIGTTGYGVVESDGHAFRLIEAGVVTTPRKGLLEVKLSMIRRGLDQVIEKCRPEVAVVEEVYSHALHPRTSILIGHARGVVLSTCSERDLSVIDLPAKRVKKAITGNGNATKDQVQNMVSMILRLKKISCPYDVSDALALAMSYVYLKEKR